MKCEARSLGEQYCNKDADYWLFLYTPIRSSELALCYEHAGLQLIQDQGGEVVKWIEPLSKTDMTHRNSKSPADSSNNTTKGETH